MDQMLLGPFTLRAGKAPVLRLTVYSGLLLRWAAAVLG